MSKYVKPVVSLDEGMAEGVYAASGAVTGGDGCYTSSAYIHQRPETGRGDYRIQVDAHHSQTAGHTKTAQTLTISFNQNVTYKSGGTKLVSGNGTPTLTISLTYTQNPNDNIGFGDLVVESEPGLAITGISVTD